MSIYIQIPLCVHANDLKKIWQDHALGSGTRSVFLPVPFELGYVTVSKLTPCKNRTVLIYFDSITMLSS